MKRFMSIVAISGLLGFLWVAKIIDYKTVFYSNIFIGVLLIIYVLLMAVWTAIWMDGVFEFFKRPSKKEAFRGLIHLTLTPVSPLIITYTIFEELCYDKKRNKKTDSDNNSNLPV